MKPIEFLTTSAYDLNSFSWIFITRIRKSKRKRCQRICITNKPNLHILLSLCMCDRMITNSIFETNKNVSIKCLNKLNFVNIWSASRHAFHQWWLFFFSVFSFIQNAHYTKHRSWLTWQPKQWLSNQIRKCFKLTLIRYLICMRSFIVNDNEWKKNRRKSVTETLYKNRILWRMLRLFCS